MPLYMDRHNIPGLTINDAAMAHMKDLEFQKDYGCNCITYWLDEERENIFCLIEGPDKRTVRELHNKAHGLIPHDIIEVDRVLVKSFLGRIHDPDPAESGSSKGSPFVHDPAYRCLLVADMKDRPLFEALYGKSISGQLMRNFNSMLQESMKHYAGLVVENQEVPLMSFVSVTNAIDCALYLRHSVQFQNTCSGLPKTEVKIGLSEGFPVGGSSQLFGEAIEKARKLSFVSDSNRVILTVSLKEQYKGSAAQVYNGSRSIRVIHPEENVFLEKLLSTLQAAVLQPSVNIEMICRNLGVSASTLYRNTIQLTGLSPNDLLKEIRLNNSLALMQKQGLNISEVSYELGFTNPSYFTRCFKKRFNLLPADFFKSVHTAALA